MAGRKPKSALPVSRPSAVGRSDFAALLAEVKGRIQAAQTRAVLAVNAELVRLYWDIGRIIADRQRREGWGAAVIPRLAKELKNELPEMKGFSERNIDRMIAFYRAYPDPAGFSPPAVAKLLPPDARPPAGRVQLRRHRQADRHLDLRADAGAAGAATVGAADGGGDRGGAGACLPVRQAEGEKAMNGGGLGAKLDAGIEANLKGVGDGG